MSSSPSASSPSVTLSESRSTTSTEDPRARSAARRVRTVVDHDTARTVAVVHRDDPLRLSALETRQSNNPGGEGSGAQSWSEFLQGGRSGETGSSYEALDANRFSATIVDRKRRLMGVSDDSSRYHYDNNQTWATSSSTSHAEFETRPLLARPQRRDTDFEGPGISHDNSIDISDPDPPEPHGMDPLPSRHSYIDYGLPQWQHDSEVSKCPICGTSFSFWYRKHHCRKCGRVVCASCSPHRITIPRQFIVRPPNQNRPLSTFIQPLQSEIQVINLIGNHPPERGDQFLDSALGGGEEVRLCNPCVPDPNPEPPRRYSATDSFPPRSERTAPNWSTDPTERSHVTGPRSSAQQGYYHNPGSRNYNLPLHRPSHTPSSTITPRSEEAREFRQQRGRGMIVCLPNTCLRRCDDV